MICRPMLWIAATTVAVGAVASTPSIVVAEPGIGWNVTIDEPATDTVTSKHLVIEGSAALVDLPLVDDQPTLVTVTVLPQGGLLEHAGCNGQFADTTAVTNGRYHAEIDVFCNGPYRIQVVARARTGSSGPQERDIGVVEVPDAPPMVGLDESPEGGLVVTWQPATEPDAAGWVITANSDEFPIDDLGVTELTLPPAFRDQPVWQRARRWGAGGPGTTIESGNSMGALLGHVRPPTTTTEPPTTTPTEPEPPPSNDPTPPSPPPPSNPPSGTAPPNTNGATPTRGTGAPSTTLPDGYSPELPFGAPEKAFVPGGEPSRSPSSNAEERAVSTSAPIGGLVRTTEKQSPGLVAPFALGLLMLTMAIHIAWYLRRTRPGRTGQVRLP